VCDKTNGKQGRSPTITVPALNSATACPDPEERECDIDCEFTWPEWSICDKTVGKQGRSPTITVPALNGATACPGPDERNCGVDCEYKWSEWGVCGSAGFGKHERTVIIETPCFPSKCPLGHLPTGAPCPPKENKICMVDCESTHDDWTVCDAVTGEQTRSVTTTVQPFAGGAPCLQPESRKCKVDCEVSFNTWKCLNTDVAMCSSITVPTGCDVNTGLPKGCTSCDKVTGKQNRDHNVDVTPKDGWNGQGAPCPPHQEQDCIIDCEGYWGAWSTCASPSGNYPPFTRSRSYVITVPPLNLGQNCPDSESEPCLPEVCYSADVEDSGRASFGPKKMDMKPLRTLSPNHPAFSRTDCDGKLTPTDNIPTADSNKPEHCTGPDLFYALDASTKKNRNNNDK